MSQNTVQSERARLLHEIGQALDNATEEAAKLPPDDISGFLLAIVCEDVNVAACRSCQELLDELRVGDKS